MEVVVGVFLTELSYLFFWFLMNKARHSKNQSIREMDNGYAFYSSLCEEDRESYWKEDTRIVNLFFVVVFVLLQIMILTCAILPFRIGYLYILMIGFVVSLIVFIRKSLQLQKKYTNKEEKL